MTELEINLEGLEDKWSVTLQDDCCDCGMNFEENNEIPLILWRNSESPQCTSIALCEACSKKRMGS